MNQAFLQKLQELIEEFPNQSLVLALIFIAGVCLAWGLRALTDNRRFRVLGSRLRGARDQAHEVAEKLLEADKKHAELMRLISRGAQAEADQLNAAATEAGVLFLDLRRANAALQAALDNQG